MRFDCDSTSFLVFFIEKQRGQSTFMSISFLFPFSSLFFFFWFHGDRYSVESGWEVKGREMQQCGMSCNSNPMQPLAD